MRKSILVLFLLWSFFGYSQNDLYCLHDTAGFYRIATINTNSGVISNIASLPGLSFYVLGNKDCTSTHDSTYVFCGHDGTNARLYTLDLTNGSILSSPSFTNNVVGLRYNCNDSMIYAIEEVTTNNYYLVTVDKTTGLTTQKGAIGGVSAYVGDGFVLDTERGLYHFLGLQTPNIYIYSIDIKTGLVIASFPFSDNVTGLNFNCNDSTIYGVWEDGPDYKLEKVIPSTGIHTTVGKLTNITPGFVAESASISKNGEYTYRGFSNTNASVLVTVDVQTANIIDTIGFTNTVSGLDHYACCINNPVSINSMLEERFLKIYPNPFTVGLKLEWSNDVKNAVIKVFDICGQLVYSENEISGASYYLKRNNLTAGIYFVEVNDSQILNWIGKIIAE